MRYKYNWFTNYIIMSVDPLEYQTSEFSIWRESRILDALYHQSTRYIAFVK